MKCKYRHTMASVLYSSHNVQFDEYDRLELLNIWHANCAIYYITFELFRVA